MATAHSIAADDDSPAPTGTFESIMRSRPGTAARSAPPPPSTRGLPSGPRDAERILRPVARERPAPSHLVEFGDRHLGEEFIVGEGAADAQHPVVAGSGSDERAPVDRERQHEPLVVVGVLADQVDATGRRPDAERFVPEAFAEGLAHVVSQVGHARSIAFRMLSAASSGGTSPTQAPIAASDPAR